MLKNNFLIFTVIVSLVSFAAPAGGDQEFTLAWTHEAGGDPWGYVEHIDIIGDWQDRFDVGEVKIRHLTNYLESIRMYTEGEVDACVMRAMDALTIPALRGVDSTVLLIGDFSRGSEGIVMQNGLRVSDLRGRPVRVEELSVSHYLLVRALAQHGMSENDVTLVNTRDEDMPRLFAQESVNGLNAAVSTRDGYLTRAAQVAGASLVFDSAQLVGENMDVLLVRTGAADGLKRALAGAWFAAMQIVGDRHNPERADAVEFMAGAMGVDLGEYKTRLKKKKFFFSAREAAAFMKSRKLKITMELIRSFSVEHGLYGGSHDENVVGIRFPDGSVMGDENNITLRFDDSYMRMASDWLWLQ